MSRVVSLDIGELPAYVEKLPINLRMYWKATFLNAAELYGYDRALAIANRMLISKIDDLKRDEIETFEEEVKQKVFEEFVSTDLMPEEEEIVSFSEDGEIILNAVLATGTPSTNYGLRYTQEALVDMAEQINRNGITLPDVEHEVYNKILEEFSDAEEIEKELLKEKGLLTKIKAFVSEGKLKIRAWLDKRYKRYADNYKGLSIETRVPLEYRNNGKITKAKVLGFTFTNKPDLKGSNVLNVE